MTSSDTATVAILFNLYCFRYKDTLKIIILQILEHFFLPSIFHLPSSIIPHPSSILHLPSSLFHHPSSIIHHPSSFFHHPSSIIPLPSSFFHHPSSFFHHPSSIFYPPSDIRQAYYHVITGSEERKAKESTTSRVEFLKSFTFLVIIAVI